MSLHNARVGVFPRAAENVGAGPTRTQIYILSRDRADFCRETINSALMQNAGNYEIVVSDNSEGDAVQKMVEVEFPRVTYVRRRPTLPALDHFRAVMNEATAEEVVFFHDDDLLFPDYLEHMRKAMEANPDAAAVGCDAWILRGEKKTQTSFMMAFEKDLVLSTPEALLTPYLRFSTHRAAPFPGYMYRRRHVAGLYLDAEAGGKHSDVAFLVDVVSRSPIVWLARPLMYYRMHANNDSVQEQVGQRLRLLRFVYRNTAITPDSICVDEFRFRYLLRWWRASRAASEKTQPWRYAIISRFLLIKAFRFLILRPSIWLRIATGAR